MSLEFISNSGYGISSSENNLLGIGWREDHPGRIKVQKMIIKELTCLQISMQKKQANNTSKNAVEGFLPNNKIAVFLSS